MLAGFLVFADEPKPAARQSLSQLADFGIELKIATGRMAIQRGTNSSLPCGWSNH